MTDVVRPRSRARRILRSPLVQLTVVGALLVGAHAALERLPARASRPIVRAPIVISATRARSLESGFASRWGRGPSAAERSALLEQAVQDEMLYREARVLALGFQDPSVRRRLVEMMRVVGDKPGRSEDELVRDAVDLGLDDDVVIRRLLAEKMRLVLRQGQAATPVSDAELATLLERDREQFRRPETVTLQQLFLSTDARGSDAAARDAGRLLAALRSGDLSADGATAQCDALPLGDSWRSATRVQLQGRFGKDFADAVFALDAGAWSGPIASPFGLHLVRIVQRQPARVATLDEVRPALVEVLRRERAQANFRRGLDQLRSLYEVRIENASNARPAALDVASAR